MADLGEVPQAAVEAGLRAAKDAAMGAPTVSADRIVERALAAAAPHIAAAALRQAAEDMWDRSDGLAQVYSAWLRHRANQVDGRQPSPATREGVIAAAGLTEADMQERPVRVIENFRLESYGPDPYGMGAVISVTREAGEEQADG